MHFAREATDVKLVMGQVVGQVEAGVRPTASDSSVKLVLGKL